jgi:hypothetical protein
MLKNLNNNVNNQYLIIYTPSNLFDDRYFEIRQSVSVSLPLSRSNVGLAAGGKMTQIVGTAHMIPAFQQQLPGRRVTF